MKPNDVSIKQLFEMKRQLETNIALLFAQFTDNTGLEIHQVNVNSLQKFGSAVDYSLVNIDIKL